MFVVIIRDADYGWGIFRSLRDAEKFAEFATREIDPATIIRLHSPLRELFAYYEREDKNGESD